MINYYVDPMNAWRTVKTVSLQFKSKEQKKRLYFKQKVKLGIYVYFGFYWFNDIVL